MGIKSVEIYRFTATPVYSSVEECTVENLMDFFFHVCNKGYTQPTFLNDVFCKSISESFIKIQKERKQGIEV